jgi:hypothetical protein
MFNKKLKRKLRAMEDFWGIVFTDGMYECLSGGLDIMRKRQIDAVVDYLDIKDTSGIYGDFKYEEKK